MTLNDKSENLDDIFLTKDKNKSKRNNEKTSEEKARETEQIVSSLKEMQKHGEEWYEEHKNEVRYERNGLVSFESLTKQKPRTIKRGRKYERLMEGIDAYLTSKEISPEIKKLLQDTKDYLLQGIFDVFDAKRYLTISFALLIQHGKQLNESEKQAVKSFKNRRFVKNIITIIVICLGTYLIIRFIR